MHPCNTCCGVHEPNPNAHIMRFKYAPRKPALAGNESGAQAAHVARLLLGRLLQFVFYWAAASGQATWQAIRGGKLYTLHGVTTEHDSAAVFAVAAALKRFKTMLKEERGRMHVIGTCADTWLMPACAYFRNGMMMRSTNDAHERRGTLSRSRHAPKRFKACAASRHTAAATRLYQRMCSTFSAATSKPFV